MNKKATGNTRGFFVVDRQSSVQISLLIAPKLLKALKALREFRECRGNNFEFWQMRVSERKGCLQTLPSGSILDKTLFCQFCSPYTVTNTHRVEGAEGL